MAIEDDFMSMQEEEAQGMSHFVIAECHVCGQQVDVDDHENYREVRSWVNGPKLDGPVLREQTGQYAHKACIMKLINGQAPDQEELF